MGCCCWTYFFIAIFLAWSYAVICYVNYLFNVKFKYLEKPLVQNHRQFSAFTRADFPKWNKTHMILGGIFLFPIRIVLFFFVMISGWVWLHILIRVYRVKDLNAEQPVAFSRFVKFVTRFCNRASLFIFGFYRINELKKKFNQNAYPNLECSTHLPVTMIISNHVSYIDIFYLASRPDPPCFVAKAETANIPFIGLYARAIQCIFVKRESREARQEVMNLLTERIDKIKAGLNYSKMIIFPEATTTSGRALLKFKKGPFVVNTPLKVLSIQYSGKFSPSYNLINLPESIFGVLSQWSTSIDIIEMQGLISPKKPMAWEEFAEEVREMMCQEFGFEKANYYSEDRKAFDETYVYNK